MVELNSLYKRVIPKILISTHHKSLTPQALTTKFYEPFRFIGEPESQALIFQSNGADELFLVNLSPDSINHSSFRRIVEKVNRNIFMPLAVGGGIFTYDSASRYFDLGIEKIVVERIFETSPREIIKVISTFGSQSVVGSCSFWGDEASFPGKVTHRPVLRPEFLMERVKFMEDCGVGELLLNDVSRDGTRKGSNLSVLHEVLGVTKLPIIDSCGFGKTTDFIASLSLGSAAVAVGTYFAFVDQSFLQLRGQLSNHGIRVRM
jgi:cyclase